MAITWGVTVHSGMAALALAGRALLPDAANGEALFYEIAGLLLPAILAGIVIAAVLSAVMSTVDSLLVAASAAAAHDLGLLRVFKGREVMISRCVMASICVLGVALTLFVPASIFDRVLFSWSALGAAFGPVVAARVMGVEPRGIAILAAMISGFAATVFFYAMGQSGGEGVFAQLAALPGDPFERVFPWLIPLALLFGLRQPKTG